MGKFNSISEVVGISSAIFRSRRNIFGNPGNVATEIRPRESWQGYPYLEGRLWQVLLAEFEVDSVNITELISQNLIQLVQDMLV